MRFINDILFFFCFPRDEVRTLGLLTQIQFADSIQWAARGGTPTRVEVNGRIEWKRRIDSYRRIELNLRLVEHINIFHYMINYLSIIYLIYTYICAYRYIYIYIYI